MVLTAVPRATVPRRQAHRRARLLLAAAASGPVLGLLALAVAAGRGGPGPRPPAVTAGHDRAFAQVAAEDMLAGRATELPLAAGVDPFLGRATGDTAPVPIAYQALVWRSASTGTTSGVAYEIDTFLVATSTGLWHLAVEVEDAAAGPVVGADPSLAPDPTAPTATVAPVPYPGPAASLGPGATRQLRAWAAAYVGGDAAALRRLTGDAASASFATLVGWALDGAQVTGATVRGTGALAQVTVTMHLRSDDAVHATSAYDVLLGDLHQPLPPVQAWGPPGSGPTLTPLTDAVAGGS